MKRSNEQSLGDVIKDLLRNYGLEKRVTQVRIANTWDKVMGKFVAAKTVNVKLRNDTLLVKLNSPALRNELSYAKEKIIESINKECGDDVIKKIVFM